MKQRLFSHAVYGIDSVAFLRNGCHYYSISAHRNQIGKAHREFRILFENYDIYDK